jgi:hypothetical protein
MAHHRTVEEYNRTFSPFLIKILSASETTLLSKPKHSDSCFRIIQNAIFFTGASLGNVVLVGDFSIA